MLAKSITALAAFALVANVAAEPLPYRPNAMKMSTRELFGVVRRGETPGYQPEQAACNAGNTCSEACGAGYETCASSDDQIHCFNPTVGEICCPNQSGDSCQAGYYCTSDTKGETWCCPDAMDLAACAASYNVDGGLVSQTPPAVTTTSTTSSTSTSQPPTTTSSSSSSTTISSSSSSSSLIVVERNTTSIAITTAAPTKSFAPSASYVPSNSTSISLVSPALPTGSDVVEAAGSMVGPAGALVFLAAGLAALL